MNMPSAPVCIKRRLDITAFSCFCEHFFDQLCSFFHLGWAGLIVVVHFFQAGHLETYKFFDVWIEKKYQLIKHSVDVPYYIFINWCFFYLSNSITLVQTFLISSGLWLTTSIPIFLRSVSSMRKCQIWLWVMRSSMVVISSARRKRVLCPRALAMQKRCNSPPESSVGNLFIQSGSIPSFSISSGAVLSPSSITFFMRSLGFTACSGCCQIICTGQYAPYSLSGLPSRSTSPLCGASYPDRILHRADQLYPGNLGYSA